jgi:uncharacterized protein (DUF2141 family)
VQRIKFNFVQSHFRHYLHTAAWWVGVLCFACLFLSVNSETKGLRLTLHITNIQDVSGRLQVGIYNNKSDFPKEGKEFKRVYIKVDGKEVKFTVQDMPPGDYAIAIYHDANTDGQCNSNFLGVPTECYGFSNNVKPFLSAPSFNATKFSLTTDRLLTIRLQN